MHRKNVKSAGDVTSLRGSYPQFDKLRINSSNDNKTCRPTKSQGTLPKTLENRPLPTNLQQGFKQVQISYKNSNFCDSQSTIEVINELGFLNTQKDELVHETLENKTHVLIGQRPVTCPHSTCQKMVAIESILLHFYFDHPKIPRQFADVASQTVLSLKLSQLTRQSKCLFIIFPTHSKRSKPTSMDQRKIESYALLTGNYKDSATLILMGAVMSKENNECIATTEKQDISKEKNKMKTKTGINTLNDTEEKSDNTNEKLFTSLDPKSEYLIIWTCKLDDKVKYYEVTLQRHDKKLAHSYVGEAIHIRENNKVESIYERAECLMINGVAVKKLFDKREEIQLIVNILDL